jgi:hypothetical protein
MAGGIAGPIPQVIAQHGRDPQQVARGMGQFPQQPGQIGQTSVPPGFPQQGGLAPFSGPLVPSPYAGTIGGPRPVYAPFEGTAGPGAPPPQQPMFPGMGYPAQQPQQPMNPYEGMTQVGPGSYERLDGSPGSMQPSTSMTPLQKSMMNRYNPQRPQPQTQPMNPQRGLGGLQSLMNKFRNRLG